MGEFSGGVEGMTVRYGENRERVVPGEEFRLADAATCQTLRLLTPALSSFEEEREKICGTVDPGRRSVLAHGHHSLCPGLFSFGLSALQFGVAGSSFSGWALDSMLR